MYYLVISLLVVLLLVVLAISYVSIFAYVYTKTKSLRSALFQSTFFGIIVLATAIYGIMQVNI